MESTGSQQRDTLFNISYGSSKRNVLLIGGAGFIGRHLKNYLEIIGNNVDVFDKKLRTNINDEYSFTTTDVEYLTAVASFQYSYYQFI